MTVERMLSVTEVAMVTGLSKSAVYRAIEDGELAASKLRGRLKIDHVELEAWKQRTRVQPRRREPPTFEDAAPSRSERRGDTFRARLRTMNGGRR